MTIAYCLLLCDIILIFFENRVEYFKKTYNHEDNIWKYDSKITSVYKERFKVQSKNGSQRKTEEECKK